MAQGAPWYPVQVEGLDNYRRQRRQVVFHAINKSGSSAMSKVLFEAYFRSKRANQVMSTYRKTPADLDLLRRIISGSAGHSLFVAHDLYGSYRVRPCQVLVTQFRNPVPRARSCHQWLKERHGVDLSFEQWVTATRGLRHTQMEQFAIGYAEDRRDWRTMTGEEMFDLAVANIERDVAWFGIAERLEESIHAMAAMCGVKRVPAWRRDTRNPNRPLVSDWEPGEQEMVREVFRWDCQLYDWAYERFESRIATLDFGPDFATYQAACRDEYKDRLDPAGREIGADARR